MLFREYFQCGTIRPDRSDYTVKYEVRSVDDLVKKIIPHFEKYPMISSKNSTFIKFAEICRRMSSQEHLTEKGFNEIIQLSLAINPSSRKKFPRSKIKI